MNRIQRFVAWLWGITIFALTVVPPWTNRGKREFAFILSPPDYYTIEFGMLILEWVIVSMVFGGLFAAFRSKQAEKRPGIIKRSLLLLSIREGMINKNMKRLIAREGLIIIALSVLALATYALHEWQRSKLAQYYELPKLIGEVIPKFVPPPLDSIEPETKVLSIDFKPDAKPSSSAKGLFDDAPDAKPRSSATRLYDDLIPPIRAHKLDLEPIVSFSFPKGTKAQVIRNALRRDYGDSTYLYKENRANSEYVFSENNEIRFEPDVLDEVFAVPYDSKGNRLKRMEDKMFYRLPFKKLSIVLLACAYPLYWLVRFVVWAVNTLRTKEECNAGQ